MIPTEIAQILPRLVGACVLVDHECKVAFWSRGARDLFGYTEKEVLGKLCYELIQGRDRSGALFRSQDGPTAQIVARKAPLAPFELSGRAKDGTQKGLLCASLLFEQRRRSAPLILYQFHEVESRPKTPERVPEKATKLDKDEALRLKSLSPREREILLLVAKGIDTLSVGRKLVISPTTVRNHIQNILRKLGVHSKLEAIVCAYRHHLLPS